MWNDGDTCQITGTRATDLRFQSWVPTYTYRRYESYIMIPIYDIAFGIAFDIAFGIYDIAFGK